MTTTRLSSQLSVFYLVPLSKIPECRALIEAQIEELVQLQAQIIQVMQPTQHPPGNDRALNVLRSAMHNHNNPPFISKLINELVLDIRNQLRKKSGSKEFDDLTVSTKCFIDLYREIYHVWSALSTLDLTTSSLTPKNQCCFKISLGTFGTNMLTLISRTCRTSNNNFSTEMQTELNAIKAVAQALVTHMNDPFNLSKAEVIREETKKLNVILKPSRPLQILNGIVKSLLGIAIAGAQMLMIRFMTPLPFYFAVPPILLSTLNTSSEAHRFIDSARHDFANNSYFLRTETLTKLNKALDMLGIFSLHREISGRTFEEENAGDENTSLLSVSIARS